MGSIIIPATRSLTITNKFPNGNINEDIILIGYDGKYHYSSFLFFDISPIPIDVSLTKAELVLFKTDSFYDDRKEYFYVYPLFNYFSTYTTYNNPPSFNHMINKSFNPLTSKVSVTINLMEIVSLWASNKFANKGIILCENDHVLCSFGSAKCNDTYLIPFIKVDFSSPTINKHGNTEPDNINSCKVNPCNMKPCQIIIHNNCCNQNVNPQTPTIRQIDVTGTVAPESKYDAIIELEVKRSSSGIIDKYYASDEYDNSSSNKPLFIDRTYNIAVNPPENPGDVETINFYGSYKE